MPEKKFYISQITVLYLIAAFKYVRTHSHIHTEVIMSLLFLSLSALNMFFFLFQLSRTRNLRMKMKFSSAFPVCQPWSICPWLLWPLIKAKERLVDTRTFVSLHFQAFQKKKNNSRKGLYTKCAFDKKFVKVDWFHCLMCSFTFTVFFLFFFKDFAYNENCG